MAIETGVFAPFPPEGVSTINPVPTRTYSENVKTILTIFSWPTAPHKGLYEDTVGAAVSLTEKL